MIYNPFYAPQPLVYDPKLGYVPPQRLAERGVRQDVNRLTFTALGLHAASIFGGILIAAMALSLSAFSMSGLMNYAFTGFLTVLGTAVPFLIYLLVGRRPLGEYLRFEKTGAANALLYVLAGLGCCLATNIPAGWISAILEGFGLNSDMVALPMAEGPGGKVLMFVTVAVLPGVFEEFAFRGVVLSVLRKYGDGFAILTSSLIFGLMHLSPISSFAAIIAGLVLGFLYVKTGNLWVPIAVHLLNNAVSVTGVLMGDENLVGNLLLLYVPIALGLGALVVLLRLKRLSLNLGRGTVALPAGRKAACVLSNPGFILLALSVVTYGVFSLTGGFGL